MQCTDKFLLAHCSLCLGVGDTGVAEIFESGGSIQPKPIMLSEKNFLSGKKSCFQYWKYIDVF